MELVRSTHVPRAPGNLRSSPHLTPNGGTDDRRDVFHVAFDPEDESVFVVLTEAVAVIQDTAPEALTPLSDVLDVDAIEALFDRSPERQPNDLEVTFEYESLAVTIASTGDIWLRRI